MTSTEAGGDLEEASIAEQRAMSILQVAGDEWDSKPSGDSFLEKDFGRFRAVIDKRPELLRDKQGRVVGVDAWVRLFDDDRGREIPIDPHRRIINPPTVPRSGIVEEDTGELDPLGNPIKRRILTANPLRAFYEAVRDSIESEPNAKGWRTRGTVTTVFSDSSDGDIGSSNATYSVARSGSALDEGSVDTNIRTGQQTGYACYETFLAFDTSSIPDLNVVSAVLLEIWVSTDQSATDFTWNVREHAWTSVLDTSAWIAGASISAKTLLASRSTSGLTAAAYNSFTSNAAFLTTTNIKTGTVKVILSSSRHEAGTTPTGLEYIDCPSSEFSGTTQDPKLTITHAVPIGSSPMFTSQPNRIWRLG